jgi:hypothetical protein
MMESPLLPAPAEDSALHNLFGLVFLREWLKTSYQVLFLPGVHREFFERQVFNIFILPGENHE